MTIDIVAIQPLIALVAGILILFTLALTWIAVIPGLTAKSADGANGIKSACLRRRMSSVESALRVSRT